MNALNVIFRDKKEFENAARFFQTESNFCYDDAIVEYKTLIFIDDDIATLEHYINNELISNGFNTYYFE